jgi:hypothetical protein
MLGDWDYTYEQYEEWALLQGLFMCFTTIVLVLLLNMLIAMMGESYKGLKDESRAAGMIKQLLQIGRLREITYNHSNKVALPDFYTPLRTNLGKALRRGKHVRTNERRKLGGGEKGGAADASAERNSLLVVDSWEPLAEIHHYSLEDLAKSIQKATESDNFDDETTKKTSCWSRISLNCCYHEFLRPMFYTILGFLPHVLLSWVTNLRGKYMHGKKGLFLRCRESRWVQDGNGAFSSDLSHDDQDEASQSFREVTLQRFKDLSKIGQNNKEEISGQISKANSELDSLHQKLNDSYAKVRGLESQQSDMQEMMRAMLAMMEQQQKSIAELTASVGASGSFGSEDGLTRRKVHIVNGRLGVGLGSGKTARGHEIISVTEAQQSASGLMAGEVIERIGTKDVRTLSHNELIEHVKAQLGGSGTLELWVSS